jgi:hypothetical protein
MRDRCRHWQLCLLASLCLAAVCAAQDRAKTYTYGIEVSGELCGYADVRVSNVADGSESYLLLEQTTIISATLLGLDVDRQIDITIHVDPETWQYDYFATHIQGDDLDLRQKIVIVGDTAYCKSLASDDQREVKLPPGVTLANNLYLAHAKRDFADGGATRQSYQVLDVENTETPVQTVTFTKVGTEVLETAVGTFEVFIVDTLNKVNGAKSRLWINVKDGMVVKVAQPNGTQIYLADTSIKEQIKRANVDDTILVKAQTDITDVRAISHMKVKASMEPVGAWLDVEGLNVRGQAFAGTVAENRLEGIFVIEHARYDGAQAPPYPPSFEGDALLAKFLGSGGFIESDDPVLIEKAREITAGSKDSWEAAVRLSRWVADNIGYEIPGGVFSRKVYDMRVGECGGHSVLLAAFCRAVGIPARGVWGCMYTPIGGGSFGQHAWTEIYMGQAGWIPVDSTAHEVDFVDSGHIRLGVFGSTEDGGAIGIALGAKTMEVLDYRLESGDQSAAEESAAGKYVAYVGAYQPPGGGEPFQVLVKNGRLAIDIPGQVVVPMNDPDEAGTWTCTLSSLVYCAFSRDDAGYVVSMEFHEIVRMRRKSDPEAIGDDVPGGLRRYLGGYFLAQANGEYAIIWDDGQLGLEDPSKSSIRHLQPSGEEGIWTIEDGKKEISFLLDDEGEVISLSVDVHHSFPRIVASAAPTPPTADDAAVTAALTEYLDAVAYPAPKPIDPTLFADDIEALWSDGTTYRGRDAVVNALEQGAREVAADFESFDAKAENVRIQCGDDVARVTCHIKLTGALTEGRGTFARTIRSSFVFEKRGDRWQMAYEHSSRLADQEQ